MLSGQRGWYVRITGKAWPEGAQLVQARHGLGMQDKRHLWLFEGTPEQFDAVLKSGGWNPDEQHENRMISADGFVAHEISRHYAGRGWSPVAAYVWWADDDAKTGPFGPGWLLVDASRTRWCVWWAAI